MERTFMMIKPDGVRRKLVGEIISRIERHNLNIIAMKMLTPSRELADEHYAVHRGKYFFDGLVEFITSGPVVAMVIEGECCTDIVRKMMGKTNPEDAAPGTIRGDLGTSTRENLVHGADSHETATNEIRLWFGELDQA